MSDIFEEIDEELRHDQAYQFWKKNRNLIIGAIVLLALIMGGYFLYKQWSDNKAFTAGNQLQTALEAKASGDNDAALATLSDLASKGGAYEVVAQMERAKILLDTGKREEALAAYETVRNNSGAGEQYQDFATLMSGLVQLDSLKPDAMKSLLASTIGDGQPYSASAEELIILNQLQSGDEEGAKAGIEALQEVEDISEAMKRRLEGYLTDLTPSGESDETSPETE